VEEGGGLRSIEEEELQKGKNGDKSLFSDVIESLGWFEYGVVKT